MAHCDCPVLPMSLGFACTYVAEPALQPWHCCCMRINANYLPIARHRVRGAKTTRCANSNGPMVYGEIRALVSFGSSSSVAGETACAHVLPANLTCACVRLDFNFFAKG